MDATVSNATRLAPRSIAATRPLCVGFSSATRVARFQLGNLEVRFYDEAAKRERAFVLSEETLRLIDLQLERWRREAHEATLLAMNRRRLSVTLADAAGAGGLRDTMLLLSRGADANFLHQNWSALFRSVHAGHLAVATALLDAGASVGLGLALGSASQAGRTSVVALLLDRGADVHFDDDDALRWSAYKGHVKSVRLLLGRGANIHARNDEALRRQCRGSPRNMEMTRLLLDRGANIHAQNDKLLRDAVTAGQHKMARLLLDRGANIHALHDRALRAARSNGHGAVVALLVERGAMLSGS